MAQTGRQRRNSRQCRAGIRMRDLSRGALWGISAASALIIAALCRARPRPVATALACGLGRNPRHSDAVRRQAGPPARCAARAGGWPRPCACSPPTASGCSPASPPLKHNVDDITGSIARVEKTTRRHHAAVRLPPGPVRCCRHSRAGTGRSPRRTDVTVEHQVRRARPSPSAAAAARRHASAKPSSASISAAPPRSRRLRTAWTAALRRHGTLLEGLRPVVQTRERPRPGGIEFRLIAGPDPQRRGGGAPLRRDDGGRRRFARPPCSTAAARDPLNVRGIIVA